MAVAYYTVSGIIHEVLRTLNPSFYCICEVVLAELMYFCLCTAASVKLLRVSISHEHLSVYLNVCDSVRTVLRQMSELQVRAFSTAAR
jgi:hypothetical protein